MSDYTFTLVLDRPRRLDDQLGDALFEAGCDDAAVGEHRGTVYLEFDREAPSFLHAVLSAIGDVHSVPGAVVSHVEPDEHVTATEIADRIGRSRENVRQLAEGMRGPGGFPAPVSGASGRRTRFWRWSEVADWLERHGFASGAAEQGRVIAAVNGALTLSRNASEGARHEILEGVEKAS